MYEIAQSQIARAVDVLKNGPMPARTFAEKMWPGRHESAGSAKIAGNTVLHRLGKLGYVEKAGDMWFLRGFSNSASNMLGTEFGGGSGGVLGTQLPAVSPAQLPTGTLATTPGGSPNELLEQSRLQQLVQLADAPVPSVTHDAVLGNIRIRGLFVDDCISEACAFAVLRGRSLNAYLPDGPMLVGLTPVEGARALHLRWKQSGMPPEPPHRGGSAWITAVDGVIALPGCWKPLGAGPQWESLEEPILARLQRQRAAAGLGPPVQNGGRR